MLIVLFDLDGVIVDNTTFEEAVTERIIRRLAEVRNLGFAEASDLWRRTLVLHADHPQWHNYGFHCEQLGLGEVWKKAHIAERSRLRLCEGIEHAITQASNADEMWIVSDATQWVVGLKLETLALNTRFSRIFTSDHHGHKGGDTYWQIVAHELEQKRASSIYVDNRTDRLRCARRVLERCSYLHVNGADHAQLTSNVPYDRNIESEFVSCAHSELSRALEKIMESWRSE